MDADVQSALDTIREELRVLKRRVDHWGQNGIGVADSQNVLGEPGGVSGESTLFARADHTHEVE